jgi:hypothetical protein
MDEGSHQPQYPQAERRKGGDRRRRRKYRFHDRRSGFERRVNGVQMGLLKGILYALRDRPRALAGVVVAANALSLADFLVTLLVLDHGGREANPVLRSLLELSPLWAGIFKVVLVLAASLLVWANRYYRKALIAGLWILVVFACVVIYDLVLLALLH